MNGPTLDAASTVGVNDVIAMPSVAIADGAEHHVDRDTDECGGREPHTERDRPIASRRDHHRDREDDRAQHVRGDERPRLASAFRAAASADPISRSVVIEIASVEKLCSMIAYAASPAVKYARVLTTTWWNRAVAFVARREDRVEQHEQHDREHDPEHHRA